MIKKKIFCLWAAALILSGCAGVFQGKEKETEPDFVLTYAENQGAAFSILEGKRLFFVGMTVVMILLMLLLLKKGYIVGLWGKTAAAFVIGGALGNGIDRVLRGYVVDMFEVRFIRFAIFNVADIFITVGGVMLVIYFLFLEGKTLGGKE